MAKYKSIVVTDLGLALVAATHSGGTIQFTSLKTGNGVYSGTEVLKSMKDLKSVRQTIGVTGLTREAAVVKVRSILTNEGVTEGYYVTEIGLYAMDPSINKEILYAIIVAEKGKEDYLLAYSDSPQSITFELYIATTGVEEGVTFTASIIEGIYATVQDLEEHLGASNPHKITKSTIGLGNVPNVATNDQTPTYTAASANAALTSGEKISVAFGKIAKAVSSLISHLSNKSNPHSVTKSQVGLENVPNVATNDQTPTYTTVSIDSALTSGEKLSEAFGKISRAVSSLISHLANTSNPHSVTKEQVGLENVPNVSTNDQAPTYTVASSNTNLASGEKMSVAFGKIAKAIKSLISHLADTSNPHSVTASQVGLGNVSNVSTNDQTPTYTVASSNANLVSGEKISVAFGKIAKAIKSLISHLADTNNPHSVTASQVGAVKEGGGVGQNDNTIYIGWAGIDGGLKATVDATDLGTLVTTGSADSVVLPVAKGGTGASTAAGALTKLGAVPATETSKYNFVNKTINAINIDTVYNYNYVVAISQSGLGTLPETVSSWVSVTNFYTDHFVTQLAYTCSGSTSAERPVEMWIRERYIASSSVWSKWRLIHNDSTITAGTTDLTAGTSSLETGKIYLVYE